MGMISEAVRHMLDAGMSNEDVIRAIAAMENAAAPTRTTRQERNARYYQKKLSEKRLNKTEQDVSDVSAPSFPDKKEPPVPQEKINPSAQPRAHTHEGPDVDGSSLQAKLVEAAGDKIHPHGVFDLSAIVGLISAGVDLETDVLPTIRAKTATMQRPARGWNYFTDAIKDAHNRRITAGEGLAKPVRTVTPDEELPPEILEAEWSKRLNWARRTRSWFSAVWGPMPGAEGCRVPTHLIQPEDGKDPYGNRWDEQSARAA